MLLGTLGVAGAGYGLHAVGDSVDAELKEVAYSIRSLDQSYSISEQSGCGAWSAGSCFKQQDVAISIEELKLKEREFKAKHEKAAEPSKSGESKDDLRKDEPIEAAPAPVEAAPSA